MAILELHKITITVSAGVIEKYYCLLNPTTYTNIGAVVGVAKVTDAAEKNAVRTDVAELIRAGTVFRLLCSGKNATGTLRTFNVLCARDKLGAALDGVKGKVVNGVTLGAARVKRTATFY